MTLKWGKKLKKLLAVLLVSLATASAAQACPKGMHIHGGKGTHHKGGTCSR
ncbi:MAG: hypothetical protein ACRYHA_01980 [Janthinobacterium lividum]